MDFLDFQLVSWALQPVPAPSSTSGTTGVLYVSVFKAPKGTADISRSGQVLIPQLHHEPIPCGGTKETGAGLLVTPMMHWRLALSEAPGSHPEGPPLHPAPVWM